MKTFQDFGIDVRMGSVGELDVTCPTCSRERKKKHAKCLSVNATEGTWFCHHCGWAGSLRQGVDRSAELHWQKPVYRKPAPIHIAETPEAAMVSWFAERGITETVLRRNRISLQSVYMPQIEGTAKAVCFPYYRGDELVNAKYRDREKNFRMVGGAERILYGLNDIDPARCVVVEGECDKLSVEVAGITSCVSVPDGAPSVNTKNYDSKFTFLDADADQLEQVSEWIIAVDNDAPGTRLEQELVRRFGVEKCKRVTWPEGCKDANDVLKAHGPQKLRECIEQAKEFPIKGVIYASDLRREIELLYEQGAPRGASTGWPAFDQYFTVMPGELTVITGVPGSGKSNWLDSLLVNLADEHDWSSAIFSPENQPLAKHFSRLMEKFLKEPFRSGPTARMSRDRRDQAIKWLDRYFPMLHPSEEDDWTLDYIFDAAKALIRRHGIKTLVIDPWNELEHKVKPSELSSDYIGSVLRKIRQFARKNQIHVFLVAHPQKMRRDKNGEYPIPSLYDINGSANFYNKPDNGIVVWRDKNDPDAPVEIHVQKIRLREVGDLGVMNFRYNKVLATYEEMAGPIVPDRWGSQA